MSFQLPSYVLQAITGISHRGLALGFGAAARKGGSAGGSTRAAVRYQRAALAERWGDPRRVRARRSQRSAASASSRSPATALHGAATSGGARGRAYANSRVRGWPSVCGLRVVAQSGGGVARRGR